MKRMSLIITGLVLMGIVAVPASAVGGSTERSLEETKQMKSKMLSHMPNIVQCIQSATDKDAIYVCIESVFSGAKKK
jgi:hypothetical protein